MDGVTGGAMGDARASITRQATIGIRAMAADDLAVVHRIEELVSPDPWSRSLFADELATARDDRQWLVATVAGEVVGYGGLLFVADEAHIMNLAVDPVRQRQGIASRLVANLLLAAGDRGTIAATLEVRASNWQAQGLYRRFGFVESGHRPRYYPDGEDAVIMWVHRMYRSEFRRMLSERANGQAADPGLDTGPRGDRHVR
ncbi:MAG: ribosomal protein S18-alanine N-acetyltransferase [Acidimicrobiales bacterium]